MITLEECVAFCGTEEEVLDHRRARAHTEIAATALADYLTHQEHGIEKIRQMRTRKVSAHATTTRRSRVHKAPKCVSASSYVHAIVVMNRM
jgi:hypothetical protein